MGRPRGSQSHLPILTGLFPSLVRRPFGRLNSSWKLAYASARHYLIYASLSQCIIPISPARPLVGNALLDRARARETRSSRATLSLPGL